MTLHESQLQRTRVGALHQIETSTYLPVEDLRAPLTG
jgi:hypothetical protein